MDPPLSSRHTPHQSMRKAGGGFKSRERSPPVPQPQLPTSCDVYQLISLIDKRLQRLEHQQTSVWQRVDLVQNLVFDKLPDYERRFCRLTQDLSQLQETVKKSSTMMLRLQTTPQDSLCSASDGPSEVVEEDLMSSSLQIDQLFESSDVALPKHRRPPVVKSACSNEESVHTYESPPRDENNSLESCF